MNPRHARVPCPFEPCTARPEVLPMRGLSLASPAIDMIREHRIEPDAWFGLCPASNQQYPPTPRLAELLGEQADVLRRVAAEREQAAAANRSSLVGPTLLEQQAAAVRARRASSPRWFRNSDAGDPQQLGPVGRPVMSARQMPAAERSGGTGVATTAAVKAALSTANEKIAEAMEAARQAQMLMEEAKVSITFVRETSVDPLGGPQVNEAVDQLETVQQLAHIAIENNESYARNL